MYAETPGGGLDTLIAALDAALRRLAAAMTAARGPAELPEPADSPEPSSIIMDRARIIELSAEWLLQTDEIHPGSLTNAADVLTAWQEAYRSLRLAAISGGVVDAPLPRVGVTADAAGIEVVWGAPPYWRGAESVFFQAGSFGEVVLARGVLASMDGGERARPVVSRGSIDEWRMWRQAVLSDAMTTAIAADPQGALADARRECSGPAFWAAADKQAFVQRVFGRALRAARAQVGDGDGAPIEAIESIRASLPLVPADRTAPTPTEDTPPDVPAATPEPEDPTPADKTVEVERPTLPEPPPPVTRSPKAPVETPTPPPVPVGSEIEPATADATMLDVLAQMAERWQDCGTEQLMGLAALLRGVLGAAAGQRSERVIARAALEVQRAVSKLGIYGSAEQRREVVRTMEAVQGWMSARHVTVLPVDGSLDAARAEIEDGSCDVHFAVGTTARVVVPGLATADGRILQAPLVRRLGAITPYTADVLAVLRQVPRVMAIAARPHRDAALRLAATVMESVEAGRGTARPSLLEFHLASLFKLLHQVRHAASLEGSVRPDVVAEIEGLLEALCSVLETHHDIVPEAVGIGLRFRPERMEPVGFVGRTAEHQTSGLVQGVVWPPLVRRSDQSLCLMGGVLTVR